MKLKKLILPAIIATAAIATPIALVSSTTETSQKSVNWLGNKSISSLNQSYWATKASEHNQSYSEIAKDYYGEPKSPLASSRVQTNGFEIILEANNDSNGFFSLQLPKSYNYNMFDSTEWTPASSITWDVYSLQTQDFGVSFKGTNTLRPDSETYVLYNTKKLASNEELRVTVNGRINSIQFNFALDVVIRGKDFTPTLPESNIKINKTSAISDETGKTTITIDGENLPLNIDAYTFTTVAKSASNEFEIDTTNSTNTKVVFNSKNAQPINVIDQDLPKINVAVKENNAVVANETITNRVKITYKATNSNYIQLTREAMSIIGYKNIIGRAAIKIGIPQTSLNNDNEISRFRLGKVARRADPLVKKLLKEANEKETGIELIEIK